MWKLLKYINMFANEFGEECLMFSYEQKMLTVFAIMCLSLSLSLTIFFGYHMKLLIMNRTTNEEMKVVKVKFGLNNQLVFYMALRAKTVTFIKQNKIENED